MPGAKPFTIKLSQRCPKAVAALATALSASGVAVEPLPDAPQGAVTLVVHALDQPKLTPPQAKFLRDHLVGKEFVVITRKNATAHALRGTTVHDEFKGKSVAARRINRAVQLLCGGEPREAVQIVERELCRVVFGDEHAGAGAIDESKIGRSQWRVALFTILTAGLTKVDGETWNQWTNRVKQAVGAAAKSVGWVVEKNSLRVYMKCMTKGEALRDVLIDVPIAPLWRAEDRVTTIHKGKGAEFDTVVLFVPKATKKQCPSVQWWAKGEDPEERRIAFVAASRAKLRFVLCVHTETLAALQATQPQFLALFAENIALPAAN